MIGCAHLYIISMVLSDVRGWDLDHLLQYMLLSCCYIVSNDNSILVWNGLLCNWMHSLFNSISFVWLVFYFSLENVSLIWRRHHYRWRASNLDIYSAIVAIEQLGFFRACHTYCDTGPPFIIVISENQLTLMPIA